MEIILLTFPTAKEKLTQIPAQAQELLYTEASTHPWPVTCRERINTECSQKEPTSANGYASHHLLSKLLKKLSTHRLYGLGKSPNTFSQKDANAQLLHFQQGKVSGLPHAPGHHLLPKICLNCNYHSSSMHKSTKSSGKPRRIQRADLDPAQRHWKRLSRETVGAPLLEVFEARLVGVLSNVV